MKPSAFELQGMKNGAFPMDKEYGIVACKSYREALEAQGFSTWLEHFTGNIFIVKSEKK